MRVKRFWLASASTMAAVLGLAASTPAGAEQGAAAHDDGAKPHWSYSGPDGPDAWGKLVGKGAHGPAYPTCAFGNRQSPIDLTAAEAKGATAVSVSYKTDRLKLNPNGHTIEVAAPAGASISIGGQSYTLLQTHFHVPSEHTVNGKRFPLEAHFVHKNAKGQLAVLGVLFNQGKTNNEIEKILREKKGDNYDGKIGKFTFNPNALLPKSLKVYQYSGSLTTPPCDEGVSWNVAIDQVEASPDEIIVLETYMGKNARPLQGLKSSRAK